MNNSIIPLTELHVYRLKVGLFARRWGVKGPSGAAGLIHAGSDCWLDQITPDGRAIFGLFGEDFKDLYVTIPTEYVDEQIEEVIDKDGKPEVLS